MELSQETRGWLTIAATVVVVHSVLIGYLIIATTLTPISPSISKRLIAKTIQLHPKPEKNFTSTSSKPVVAETPSAKKTVSSKPVAKQATPQSQKKIEKKVASAKPTLPKAQATMTAKQKELLANAQKSIGNIQSSPATISESKQKMLPTLSLELLSDTLDSSSRTEGGYEQELSQCLRLYLRLPEHGTVTMGLTIDRRGNVLEVDIIHAQNLVNKKHVEKIVPTLTFPDFGERFPGAQQHTFTIVLRNDL